MNWAILRELWHKVVAEVGCPSHRGRPDMPSVDASARPACVSDYVEYLRAKKRSERYAVQVERLLTRFFAHCGRADPAHVTSADVEAWLTFRTTVESASGRTHNNERSALSAFFMWCRRTERCKTDPTKDTLPARAVQQTEYDDLTVEQVRAIIAAAEADEAVPLDDRRRRSQCHRSTVYRVAYYTGLRRGSLKGLRCGDFCDGAQPVLRARAATFKSGRPHEVPLTAEAAGVIRKLVAGRPASAPMWEHWPHDRVVIGDFKAAGISGAGGLQRFRVTVATMLADLDARPEAAQAMLGHAHISTTLKHYTRSRKKNFASEVSRLPSLADGGGDRITKKDSLDLDPVTGVDDTHGVTEVESAMPSTHEQVDRGTGREMPRPLSFGDSLDAAGRASRPVPGRFVPDAGAQKIPGRSVDNAGDRNRTGLRVPELPGRMAESVVDPDSTPTSRILILAERATGVVVDAGIAGRSDSFVAAAVSVAMAAMDALRLRLSRHNATPTPTV